MPAMVSRLICNAKCFDSIHAISSGFLARLRRASSTPPILLQASFPFDVRCDSDSWIGGGGIDARNCFNEGNWTEVRFATRCSFSSPGTRGRPADADSTFHWRQGSPPASSMSSLRIVVDHFSCMSRVFWEPLAVAEEE